MKFVITTLLMLSAAPSAFAGGFTLNLEGKTFTCTEGESSGGCECRDFRDYDYSFVGLYLKGESDNEKYLYISDRRYKPSRNEIVEMLRDCVKRKKNQFADLCS